LEKLPRCYEGNSKLDGIDVAGRQCQTRRS